MRILLEEFEWIECISRRQRPRRAGAVWRSRNLPTRSQHESRLLQETITGFIEATNTGRDFKSISAERYGKGEVAEIDHLPRVRRWIDRNRNHRSVPSFDLSQVLLEIDELAPAISAPVAAIEEHHAPFLAEKLGQLDVTVIESRKAHWRKLIAGVEWVRIRNVGHLSSLLTWLKFARDWPFFVQF
jgi:hypothetical protein